MMRLIVRISVTGPIGPATLVGTMPANRSAAIIDAIGYACSPARRHHGPAMLVDTSRTRLCGGWTTPAQRSNICSTRTRTFVLLRSENVRFDAYPPQSQSGERFSAIVKNV